MQVCKGMHRMGVTFRLTTITAFISLSVIHMATETGCQNIKYSVDVSLEDKLIPTSSISIVGASLYRCAIECSNRPSECAGFALEFSTASCYLTEYVPHLLNAIAFPQATGRKIYNTNEYNCASYSSNTNPSDTSLATLTAQLIESPNYPGAYSHNLERNWLIVKPVTSSVYLRFFTFDLEFHDVCAYDFVSIIAGDCNYEQELYKVCGTTGGVYTVTDGLYVKIDFRTDGNDLLGEEHYGFRMEYYIGQ